MTIVHSLIDFVDSSENRRWLWDDGIQAYVRKGWHVLACELRPTLDLANVQVQPAYQRSGRLRELLLAMEAQDRYHWLYVENVLSGRLGSILNKHGWVRIIVGSDDRVPSYYKRLR